MRLLSYLFHLSGPFCTPTLVHRGTWVVVTRCPPPSSFTSCVGDIALSNTGTLYSVIDANQEVHRDSWDSIGSSSSRHVVIFLLGRLTFLLSCFWLLLTIRFSKWKCYSTMGYCPRGTDHIVDHLLVQGHILRVFYGISAFIYWHKGRSWLRDWWNLNSSLETLPLSINIIHLKHFTKNSNYGSILKNDGKTALELSQL